MVCRGGFRGSLLGSFKPPFLKLAIRTNKHSITELTDELRSAVQSGQIHCLQMMSCLTFAKRKYMKRVRKLPHYKMKLL